jgi:GTP-binding protein
MTVGSGRLLLMRKRTLGSGGPEVPVIGLGCMGMSAAYGERDDAESTRTLHVVDCAALETERDPLSDIDTIEAELAAYGGLADRPRLAALNKIDVPDARDLAEIARPDLEARGLPVYEVSAATREGLRELTYAMARAVEEHRAAAPPPERTRIVIRPTAVDDSGFTLSPDGEGGWVVHGTKPQRWVRQTNFDNDEAVGYLADRLARIGIESALARAGAEPGCAVRIGDWTFDWQPSAYAAQEYVPGPRGTDYRIEGPSERVQAVERLAARKARRVHDDGVADWSDDLSDDVSDDLSDDLDGSAVADARGFVIGREADE